MKKIKNGIFLFFFIICLCSNSFSQIFPDAVGEAKNAFWLATGFKQDILKTNVPLLTSSTSIGIGRKSNPDNFNLFQKHQSFILKESLSVRLKPKWKMSLGLGYYKTRRYHDEAPFELLETPVQHEFRLSVTPTFQWTKNRFSMAANLSQEFRKYFAPKAGSINDDIQFRTRFRLLFSVNLDKEKVHKLVATSEQLFSISKDKNPEQWTDFNYRESRFCFYYSLSPKNWHVTFDLGYMYNLIEGEKRLGVHYLAFDVVVKNLFKAKQLQTKDNS